MNTTIARPNKGIINKDSFEKFYTFVLIDKRPNANIAGREYPTSFPVPNIDEIFFIPEGKTEREGYNRLICYSPGEKSIFVDEQQEKNVHSDGFKRKRNVAILFDKEGSLSVKSTEVLLLQYLKHCNWNQDIKNRMPGKMPFFKMLDFEKNARESMEKESNLIDAKFYVKNMTFEDLESYAYTLRIPVDRLSEVQIRHELMQRANKNPELFLGGMNSPQMKRKYHILKAIDNGILVKNAAANSILWAEGGMINQGAMGGDAVDSLVQFTFTPAGEMVYEMVKERLDIPKEVIPQPTNSGATSKATVTNHGYTTFPITNAPVTQTITTGPNETYQQIQKTADAQLPEVLTTQEHATAFINQAVYQKVILQKTTWYKFTDPTGTILKMQIKQLKDTLLNNPDLVNHLRSKMQK